MLRISFNRMYKIVSLLSILFILVLNIFILKNTKNNIELNKYQNVIELHRNNDPVFCKEDETTLDMANCAFTNNKSTKSNLDTLVSEIKTKLVKRQKGADDKLLLDSFVVSQSTWQKYLEEQCNLEKSFFKDGSIENFMLLNCENSLTQSRIKELEGFNYYLSL